MEFLLSQDLNLPVAGEIRTGRVVEHRNNAILIDIGAKSDGLIASEELDKMSKSRREKLAVGNEVDVCIVNPEDEDGNMILSYAQAAEEQDWRRVTELLDSEDLVHGEAVGFNRGGLLVAVGELRGFIPNSQISRQRRLEASTNSDDYLREVIGEKIQAKVIEVDRDRNRLILSERAAEQELRKFKRAEIMEQLQEGDVREGRVVNLADFGAFVDIGGIEGLVHLSELSWKRVNHPADMLELGQDVNVYVLNIDHERQRLAFSLKRLEADPWTQIEEQYQVGQLVEANITKLTKFGAFARISDEFELIGLIHISELSEEHIVHPSEVVQAGETLMVRIIRVDPEQRQLGLSLKQVSSDDFMEADLEMLSSS